MRALDCQPVRLRHSLSRHREASTQEKAIRRVHALASILFTAPLLAAGVGAVGIAQTSPKPKIEARFAGGFRPDACRWPKGARARQASACCQMELEIDASGQMTKGDGVCSDPDFLQPTLRCLAAQKFIPASQNGRNIADRHHMEYEWRATTPPDREMCNKLKTS